jgi:hypothetical protein
MREAQIIMPRDNAQAMARLRLRLLDAFGGYTQHDAIGAWRAPDGKVRYDHLYVFTVACAEPPGRTHLLRDTCRDICRDIGREADQQCVYLRGFDGEVELVSCA